MKSKSSTYLSSALGNEKQSTYLPSAKYPSLQYWKNLYRANAYLPNNTSQNGTQAKENVPLSTTTELNMITA
jgi:hypothetical protein